MEDDTIGASEAFALNELNKMNKNFKAFNKQMRFMSICVLVGAVSHAVILRSGMPLKP